ncbi:MAG: nucleotidyltransferase family protein [Acholeplasmatales bacterium]|nr:nucleotidyltransferase family protein [Acholeplasmatales bacterium]
MDISKLLKAYVNKEKINMDINNSDIKLLLEQSLQTLLYPVFQDKKYKSYYVSWVLKQESFYKLQEEITNVFNNNNINHVYFKGSVLSKLYDDPSVRTRGDIDLYVSPLDINKAKEVLLNNGYIPDTESIDCMHHYSFKKNDIEIELHFNMLDPDCDKEWINLFDNPFVLSDKTNGFLYEYKPTYHLLYCIIHFAHHLRHGAGIRYLIDFYYMFKKTNIDFKLLHEKLNECKLNILYKNIINALRMIFDIDFDDNIINEDVTFFIDYLLSYGIHGHSNNETSVQASVHKNKFTYFISRVFLLNTPYRKARYPKLYHWYLYPICLIKHWLFLITHKLGSFFKFLFGKNKNKDLYKKLGV